MPKSIKATKKFWKGEDKDTFALKDWFRAICRKGGYNCVTEQEFKVNFHDTNELAKDKEIPFPVDIYISHRKTPYRAIVEIDGEYHEDPEQQRKDEERDAAIKARYNNIPIFRFKKRDLLGDITEEQIVEKLGL